MPIILYSRLYTRNNFFLILLIMEKVWNRNKKNAAEKTNKISVIVKLSDNSLLFGLVLFGANGHVVTLHPD